MKKTIFCLLCIFFVSQTHAQKQNVSIELVNGISIPNSDFKDFFEDGFNNELSISKHFCDKLSIGMGVKHSSFNVRQEFGQTQGSRKQYRSLGFDVGPQFRLGTDKLSAKLYGRTGIMVNSTPELHQLHPNSDITTGQLKQQSLTALSARFGAKINTELCKGLELFISGEYLTALQGDLTYQSKDISKAIGADGRIDQDLASEIPTTNTKFKFSSMNVNFGISILMGKMGNHPNRRSSNPLYQGNQNKGENPMYQERGHKNNNPLYQETGNTGSNPMYEQGISGGSGHVGQSSGTRAQDYNSSRSNTTSAIELEENKEEFDKNNLKAQDYNSSRSNNSSGITNNPDTGNTKGVQAQDYNSSRSNTTSAIELEENKEEFDKNNLKAQDYNSSRSNNSSGITNNPDTGNTKGVQAQDYNSSRSNTTAAIDTSDAIRESMLASEKRKIKRKLRKEERKRLKEEKRRRKLQANEIY